MNSGGNVMCSLYFDVDYKFRIVFLNESLRILRAKIIILLVRIGENINEDFFIDFLWDFQIGQKHHPMENNHIYMLLRAPLSLNDE